MSLLPYLYRIKNAITRRYVFTPCYSWKSAMMLALELSDRRNRTKNEHKLATKAVKSYHFADQARILAPIICSEKRLVKIQYRIYHHYLDLLDGLKRSAEANKRGEGKRNKAFVFSSHFVGRR